MHVMNFLLKIFKLMLISLIRIYQVFIASPLQYFLGMPNCCRYSPTCSQYALESIKYHGIFKGVLLSVLRISRCHPWGGSGEDPVPSKDHWAAMDILKLNRCTFSGKNGWIRSSSKN